MDKSSSGKGDKPRNCFSAKFKDNYSEINWRCKKMAEWEKEVKTRCEEYDKYLTSAAEELKLRKCSHCQANMYPNYLTCPACGKETPITAP